MILRVVGLVTKRQLDLGTKSERIAIVVQTDDGAWLILRRRNGNPFSDPILDNLVGQRLAFEGVFDGNLFIVSDWTTT